jgi:hypothetical protein
VLARLDREFYGDRVTSADLDAVRFVAVPGDGATITSA